MTLILYVKNISSDTEPFDIEKLFSNFGEVITIDIPKNKSSGRNRGFAIVKMKDQKSAQNVIQNLHDTIFKDFKLKISFEEK